MKMVKIVILSMLTLFFAGCSYITQELTLTPELNVIESNTGKNLKITVIVKDERASTLFGRGFTYRLARGAEFTSSQNIEELVKREILKGLKKKGFDTTEYNEKHDREIRVELRLFEYTHLKGYFGFIKGIHVKGALKAIGKNKGREYEEMYRFESKERIIKVPTTKKNERLITAGMSHLLEELFSDERLFKLLSN